MDWRASISEREQFPVLAHSSEQHEERRTRYTKLDGSLPHVASLGRARVGGGRAKRTQQHILCTSKSKRHQGDAACALVAPTSAQLHIAPPMRMKKNKKIAVSAIVPLFDHPTSECRSSIGSPSPTLPPIHTRPACT